MVAAACWKCLRSFDIFSTEDIVTDVWQKGYTDVYGQYTLRNYYQFDCPHCETTDFTSIAVEDASTQLSPGEAFLMWIWGMIYK